MKIEVKIDGMMCEHCEKHMEEAFEKLSEVNNAKCDHTKKLAIIDAKTDIESSVIKKLVEDAGYIYIE